jgi:hypothetical protein
MTLTVKLDADLETLLAARSRAAGSTKSAIVQSALRDYFAHRPASAFELGKHLFGRRGSGKGDLSTRRHAYFAELVDAKRRRR